MKELLTSILSFINTFIQNENYVNFLSIIVVAFTSYRVAKYTASKPEKLKIRQLQFEKVYLPLFRHFSKLSYSPTLDEVTELQKETSKILEEHYELAFPQLHELNFTLEVMIIAKDNYLDVFSSMKHQIEVDYELLKKSLGYPSENFYNIFIRMTFKQKIDFLFSWFNFFALILFLFVISPIAIIQTKNFIRTIVSLLAIFFIYLFLASRLSNWINKK